MSKDKVDADGTAHLCQAHDAALELARVGLHDVGELVDDDDDVGHRFRHLFSFATVILCCLFECRLDDVFVIGRDVAHFFGLEDVVAAIHFFGEPFEGEDRLLRRR